MLKLQCTVITLLFLLSLVLSSDSDRAIVFFSEHFKLFEYIDYKYHFESKPTSVDITNFKAILKSKTMTVQPASFVFHSNLYSFVFDLTIYYEDILIVSRKDLIIDSTIKEIQFTSNFIGGYNINIILGEYGCNYFMEDLFKYELFQSLSSGKYRLCLLLSDVIVNGMKNFLEFFPPNIHKINFDQLIEVMKEETNAHAIDCDFQLNPLQTVLNLEIENIVYLGVIRGEHWSYFRDIVVSISYSVIDDKHMVTRRKSDIVLSGLEYGEFLFAFVRENKGSFHSLISKNMMEFEAKREWISDKE